MKIYLRSFLYLLYDSCGIACNYCHRRHVMGYNTLSTNYRAIADFHSGEDCGVDAYPHLILYHDRASVGSTAVIGVDIMVDGYEIALRTDENTVADGYSTATEERAALLDEAILSDSHWFAVVDI